MIDLLAQLHQLGGVADASAHQLALAGTDPAAPVGGLPLPLAQPELHVALRGRGRRPLAFEALGLGVGRQRRLDPRDVGAQVTGPLIQALMVQSELRDVHAA